MTEILLALILIVMVLIWLNLGPRSIADYLGWKRRQFRRRHNAWRHRKK